MRALWPETEPLLDQIEDAEQLTFARYCHRTLRRPVETALVHLGDSWHSTSPQLGQGANMALLDAAALSQSLSGAYDLPEALSNYAALRSPHVRLYQALSRVFTPFYQSESRLLPLLRDYLVSIASRVPPAPYVLAALVAGSAGSPLRRLGLRNAESLPFSPRETKEPSHDGHYS
ncbi:MAG TPA: FAD-dependent monooxygenase [Allosphingosinicella sp.]|uniref:FAD-dependent oxidoreductase n=1 Tax=Allosphingosinicella sp. TaxID=2823234 RepID=UPI002ED90916